ncbi:MAG TPA: hypothetical protein VGP99_12850 [Tepidisphaeraceae bacterium]|jgi:hypothetical protein|nr:hypothetical protein [Tepidisphaeraceae bacterium]
MSGVQILPEHFGLRLSNSRFDDVFVDKARAASISLQLIVVNIEDVLGGQEIDVGHATKERDANDLLRQFSECLGELLIDKLTSFGSRQLAAWGVARRAFEGFWWLP